MPWNVLIRPGSPGLAPSLRRTRLTQTRRYWRSSRYSGPQTLVRSSVCRTTLPAFAARCWSSSHSVRDSWTSSPLRMTMRRSRSISTSSKRTIPAGDEAPGAAAQDGADAGGQLVGVERLRDVVVGAEVEALGLVGRRALGRQQDHRDRAALAQLAHDLDAVDVGHDDVEQDHVGAVFLRLAQGLLAVRGRDHPESVLGQGDRDELRDPGLIVGHEDQRLGSHAHPPIVVRHPGDARPGRDDRVHHARRPVRPIRVPALRGRYIGIADCAPSDVATRRRGALGERDRDGVRPRRRGARCARSASTTSSISVQPIRARTAATSSTEPPDVSASERRMPSNGATNTWLMSRIARTRSLPSRASSSEQHDPQADDQLDQAEHHDDDARRQRRAAGARRVHVRLVNDAVRGSAAGATTGSDSRTMAVWRSSVVMRAVPQWARRAKPSAGPRVTRRVRRLGGRLLRCHGLGRRGRAGRRRLDADGRGGLGRLLDVEPWLHAATRPAAAIARIASIRFIRMCPHRWVPVHSSHRTDMGRRAPYGRAAVIHAPRCARGTLQVPVTRNRVGSVDLVGAIAAAARTRTRCRPRGAPRPRSARSSPRPGGGTRTGRCRPRRPSWRSTASGRRGRRSRRPRAGRCPGPRRCTRTATPSASGSTIAVTTATPPQYFAAFESRLRSTWVMLVSSPLTAGRSGATWTSNVTSGHRPRSWSTTDGHEVLEQRRLVAQLEALVEAGQHQQVLDQPVQAVGLAGDVRQDLVGHRRGRASCRASSSTAAPP